MSNTFDWALQASIRNALESKEYTKDQLFLEKYSYHYYFTYGTTRRGYTDYNRVIRKDRDFEWVSHGITATPYFTMFTKIGEKATNYPVVTYFPNPIHESIKRGFIWGDVFRVPTKKMLLIDEWEMNNLFFTRVPFLIRGYDNEGGKLTGKNFAAWFYLGIPQHWLKDPFIEYRQGQELKYLNNKLLMNPINKNGVYAHRRVNDTNFNHLVT